MGLPAALRGLAKFTARVSPQAAPGPASGFQKLAPDIRDRVPSAAATPQVTLPALSDRRSQPDAGHRSGGVGAGPAGREGRRGVWRPWQKPGLWLTEGEGGPARPGRVQDLKTDSTRESKSTECHLVTGPGHAASCPGRARSGGGGPYGLSEPALRAKGLPRRPRVKMPASPMEPRARSTQAGVGGHPRCPGRISSSSPAGAGWGGLPGPPPGPFSRGAELARLRG